MKLKLFILFLLVQTSSVLMAKTLPGYYITHSGDTIYCKFKVATLFDGRLDASTCVKDVLVIEGNSTKKFKPQQIKSYSVQQGMVMSKFVSLPQDKKRFYLEVVDGRISYYKLHYNMRRNKAMYGILAVDEPLTVVHVLVKSGKIVPLNGLSSKKTVARMISDYPELRKEYETKNSYLSYDLEKVIKLYNLNFLEM